jgi:uncharacterized protein
MARRFSPWNLVDRNASLEGQLSLTDLPQLQDVALSLQELEYQIAGLKDPFGTPALSIVIKGKLQISCERCLQGMSFTVDCNSDLAIKTPVQAATRSGEHELTDDCDVLIVERDEKLDAFDLLQDEILLALPLVAAHSNIEDCGEKVVSVLAPLPALEEKAQTSDAAEQTNKPFADLANLLGKAD